MAAQRGNPSTLPRITDVADSIRAGDTTVAEVAAAHNVATQYLRQRISYSGFSPDTGQPHERPRRNRTPGFVSTAEDWAADSPCSTHDNPDLWFATRPRQQAEAKVICKSCPVRARCLDYALRMEAVTDGGRHGVWGGTTPDERDVLAEGGAA